MKIEKVVSCAKEEGEDVHSKRLKATFNDTPKNSSQSLLKNFKTDFNACHQPQATMCFLCRMGDCETFEE